LNLVSIDDEFITILNNQLMNSRSTEIYLISEGGTCLFKGLFSHRSFLGALVGLGVGLILSVVNAPLILLLLAPFIAGVVSGSVGGGAKAGLLTLILGFLIVVPMASALVPPSASVPEFGQTTGVGIVGGTLSALTNGLLGSAQATMGGFAALFNQLGQILLVLVLIALLVTAVVGLIVSTIVGAIGGLIGRGLHLN
jgi:hypothetical protein